MKIMKLSINVNIVVIVVGTRSDTIAMAMDNTGANIKDHRATRSNTVAETATESQGCSVPSRGIPFGMRGSCS